MESKNNTLFARAQLTTPAVSTPQFAPFALLVARHVLLRVQRAPIFGMPIIDVTSIILVHGVPQLSVTLIQA